MTVFSLSIFYCNGVLGTFRLNDVMTPEEQKKTGVVKLSEVQKRELETWLNTKFILKTATPMPKEMTLQMNFQSGQQLTFTDGSVYEVSPDDQSKTTFWPVPLVVTIEPSDDPIYVFRITNTLTNVSVKAKQIKQAQ